MQKLIFILALVLLPSLLLAQVNTIVVSNTNDTGAGSFRQAILDANASTSDAIISFNIAGNQRITPTTLLPNIINGANKSITIDGINASNSTSQVEIYSATTSVAESCGLSITGANIMIKNIRVLGFESGIRVQTTGSFVTIKDCYIEGPRWGIRIDGADNIVEGNEVKNSVDKGVFLSSSSARSVVRNKNKVYRNIFTTNFAEGVQISGTDNVLGNAIASWTDASLNTSNHIYGYIYGVVVGGTNNHVYGNIIGNLTTDPQVTYHGIYLVGTNNVIGKYESTNTDDSYSNFIFACTHNGLWIESKSKVFRNYIGIAPAFLISSSSNYSKANTGVTKGVLFGTGSQTGHEFGGLSTDTQPNPNLGNVILNCMFGVENRKSNVTFINNFIGTDRSNLAGWGVTSTAMNTSAASNNMIIKWNVISGNTGGNAFILEGSGHQIIQNKVGTTVNGKNRLPNNSIGEIFSSNTSFINNTFASASFGLLVRSSNVTIKGNTFGTEVDGVYSIDPTSGLSFSLNSYALKIMGSTGSPINTITIGGANASDKNIFAGNNGEGIWLQHCTGVSMNGNVLGYNSNGAVLANNLNNIYIQNGCSNISIGTLAGNVIGVSTNTSAIKIDDPSNPVSPTNSAIVIQKNIIGINNPSLSSKIAQYGIHIYRGTNNVTIGGEDLTVANQITSAKLAGIYIQDNANTHIIKNNYIGTLSTGGANTLLNGEITNPTSGGIILKSTGSNLSCLTQIESNIFANNVNNQILIDNVSGVKMSKNTFASSSFNSSSPVILTNNGNASKPYPTNVTISVVSGTLTVNGTAQPNDVIEIHIKRPSTPDQVYFLASITADGGGAWTYSTTSNVNISLTESNKLYFSAITPSTNNTSAFTQGYQAGSTKTWVVTNNADNGSNTLREAITLAAPYDQIIFDLPGASKTITLESAMQSVTVQNVEIDGYNNGNPVTVIGTSPTLLPAGLVVAANNVTVRRIEFSTFEHGIQTLDGANNALFDLVTLTNCNSRGFQLFADYTQITRSTISHLSSISGRSIQINSGASYVKIFNGNKISATSPNSRIGISISNSDGTTQVGEAIDGDIQYNEISGMDQGISGGSASNSVGIFGNIVKNCLRGILLNDNNSGYTQLGKEVSDWNKYANIIIGNSFGVVIQGRNTKICGNYIGIHKDNSLNVTANLPSFKNNTYGIHVLSSSTGGGVRIGGQLAPNYIANNTSGIGVEGLKVVISYNYIGAGSNEASGHGNTNFGIIMTANSDDATIEYNKIVANGIGINASTSTVANFVGHTIRYNNLGFKADGSTVLKNITGDFELYSEKTKVENNIIAAAGTGFGIEVRASNTIIRNNTIGTDISGTVNAGFSSGIYLNWKITNVAISNVLIENNKLNANNSAGIRLRWTNGVIIRANEIGNSPHDQATGIVIDDNNTNLTIGGNTIADANVIVNNTTNGIRIPSFANNSNISIKNNYIGRTESTLSLPNGNTSSTNSGGIRIANGAALAMSVTIESNNFGSNHNYGVNVDFVNGVTITKNTFQHTSGTPISLTNGGNNSKTPPSISSHQYAASTLTLSGIASVGDVVEVFTSALNTSRALIYLGSATANGSGEWSLAITNQQVLITTQMFFSATCKNTNNSTSTLSNAVQFDITTAPCYVTTTLDNGNGSLRDAIKKANLGQCGAIQFTLPYASSVNPHVITLQDTLDPIKAAYSIDATTSPRTLTNNGFNDLLPTVKVVNGANKPIHGFRIQANNAGVHGLSLDGFSHAIIVDSFMTQATISGNYILNSTHTAIQVLGSNNIIGTSSNTGIRAPANKFKNNQMTLVEVAHGNNNRVTGVISLGGNNVQYPPIDIHAKLYNQGNIGIKRPVITKVLMAGGSLQVMGKAAPNHLVHVYPNDTSIFVNPALDASFEQHVDLGIESAVANEAGEWSVTMDATNSDPFKMCFTATSTDANNNTSEFSSVHRYFKQSYIYTVTNTSNAGNGSLREALTQASTADKHVHIIFDIADCADSIITLLTPLRIKNNQYGVSIWGTNISSGKDMVLSGTSATTTMVADPEMDPSILPLLSIETKYCDVRNITFKYYNDNDCYSFRWPSNGTFRNTGLAILAGSTMVTEGLFWNQFHSLYVRAPHVYMADFHTNEILLDRSTNVVLDGVFSERNKYQLASNAPCMGQPSVNDFLIGSFSSSYVSARNIEVNRVKSVLSNQYASGLTSYSSLNNIASRTNNVELLIHNVKFDAYYVPNSAYFIYPSAAISGIWSAANNIDVYSCSGLYPPFINGNSMIQMYVSNSAIVFSHNKNVYANIIGDSEEHGVHDTQTIPTVKFSHNIYSYNCANPITGIKRAEYHFNTFMNISNYGSYYSFGYPETLIMHDNYIKSTNPNAINIESKIVEFKRNKCLRDGVGSFPILINSENIYFYDNYVLNSYVDFGNNSVYATIDVIKNTFERNDGISYPGIRFGGKINLIQIINNKFKNCYIIESAQSEYQSENTIPSVIHNNDITYTNFCGLCISQSGNYRISQNKIKFVPSASYPASNPYQGIYYPKKEPPQLTALKRTSANTYLLIGYAEAGDLVEIFTSDITAQNSYRYLATVTADNSGRFEYPIVPSALGIGDTLKFTATATTGFIQSTYTSEFCKNAIIGVVKDVTTCTGTDGEFVLNYADIQAEFEVSASHPCPVNLWVVEDLSTSNPNNDPNSVNYLDDYIPNGYSNVSPTNGVLTFTGLKPGKYFVVTNCNGLTDDNDQGGVSFQIGGGVPNISYPEELFYCTGTSSPLHVDIVSNTESNVYIYAWKMNNAVIPNHSESYYNIPTTHLQNPTNHEIKVTVTPVSMPTCTTEVTIPVSPSSVAISGLNLVQNVCFGVLENLNPAISVNNTNINTISLLKDNVSSVQWALVDKLDGEFVQKSWNSFSTTATLSDIINNKALPLSTTSYKMTVESVHGCKESRVVTLVPSTKNVTVENSITICQGASKPIVASATGTNITYAWSPTAGLSDAAVLTPTVTAGALPETYTLTATNNTTGCSETHTVQVHVQPGFTPSVAIDQTACLGKKQKLKAQGGTVYSWLPTEGLSNASISSPEADVSQQTTYTVTIANGTGCSYTLPITVDPINYPNVGEDFLACYGQVVQLNALSGIASVPAGLSYGWSPAHLLETPNTAISPTKPLEQTTTFKVKVTNANNCVIEEEITVTVDPSCRCGAVTNAAVWTGAVSTDWNNPANWSTGVVPTASSLVKINNANSTTYSPKLDNNRTIAGICFDYGLLDLQGFTLTVTGSANFIGGQVKTSLSNGRLDVHNSGAASEFFTQSTVFDPTVSVLNQQKIILNGSTFNGISEFVQNGSEEVRCTAGNVYKKPVYFKNVGTGPWYLAYHHPSAAAPIKVDTYEDQVTFEETGDNTAHGDIYPSTSTMDKYSSSIILKGGELVFGHLGGGVHIVGVLNQSIEGQTMPSKIANLHIDKVTGGEFSIIDVIAPISVGSKENDFLKLSKGVLRTREKGQLTIHALTDILEGSNISYVEGPITANGIKSKTYPTGTQGVFMPFKLEFSNAATAPTEPFAYTVQYVAKGQMFKIPAMGDAVKYLSECDYWTLADFTQNLDPQYKVGVSIGGLSCISGADATKLFVANYTPTLGQWVSRENSDFTGSRVQGIVTCKPFATDLDDLKVFALASSVSNGNMPTSGVSFNNYGSLIGTNEASTIVVNGNILNEKTGTELQPKLGLFHHAGKMFVSSDWTNNVNNQAFSVDQNSIVDKQGTVLLSGPQYQRMRGAFPTRLFNLTLDGSGEKNLFNNVWVQGTLDLKGLTLNTNHLTLYLDNTNLTTSLLRLATGKVISSKSRLYSTEGYFARRMIHQNGFAADYLFPVGTKTSYDPVNIITNAVYRAEDSWYYVRSVRENPSLEGYDVSKKANNIDYVNTEGYHLIKRDAPINPANVHLPVDLKFRYLTSSYSSKFQSIAHFDDSPLSAVGAAVQIQPTHSSLWKLLLPNLAGPLVVEQAHTSVRVNNVIDFETHAFSLSKAGVIFNTSQFANGDNSVVLISDNGTGKSVTTGSGDINIHLGNANGTGSNVSSTSNFVGDHFIRVDDNNAVQGGLIKYTVNSNGGVSNVQVATGLGPNYTYQNLSSNLYQVAINMSGYIILLDKPVENICSTPLKIKLGNEGSGITLKQGESAILEGYTGSESIQFKLDGGNFTPVSNSTLISTTNNLGVGLHTFELQIGAKIFKGQFIVE